MYRWQSYLSYLVLFLPHAAMSYRACLGEQRLLMILPRSFISITPRVDTRIQTAFADIICLVPASGSDHIDPAAGCSSDRIHASNSSLFDIAALTSF